MNKVSQLYIVIVSVWGLRTPSAVCRPQGAVLGPRVRTFGLRCPGLDINAYLGRMLLYKRRNTHK